MSVVIWHNTRCSKSRETLALLQEKGVDLDIRDYKADAPSAEELTEVHKKLGGSVREMMRTKDAAFKELGLDDVSNEDDLLMALSMNAALIERPIVINGDKAKIGRPPESVLEILD